MNTTMIHATNNHDHTETKSDPDNNEINSIFSDPKDEHDNNWIWRESLESARRDPRNSIYYANYVGSKGTRKYVQQLSSHDPIDKKPTHYLKHLVKIGCPKHDLYPIFRDHLQFNVNPTICTHKSWKCLSPQTIASSEQHTSFGKLLHTLSFNEIGLEWKRGAYSVHPLQIKYNNTFSTNLYIKRIANTNFNKIFRPGSYGTAPSLKKGSWKDGKVFYVFKNDKLLLSVDNDINIVFELESPSTIIQDDTNKHAVIDGWKNVVGGVGFYYPPKSKSNAIHTVLVLRKSMEFPMECLQKSKIKVYSKRKNEQFFNNNHNDNKLVIGSREFSINDNININDDIFSLSNSHSPSPLMDSNQFITPSSSSCAASTISMTNPLPMIPTDNQSLYQPHTASSSLFDLSIPPQSPQFARFDNHTLPSLSMMDNDVSSYNYGGYHGGSGSVISRRYNPMNCMPSPTSFDTLSADPFHNHNNDKPNRFYFDVHEMRNRVQTNNNKFEYNHNGYLLRQNHLLRNKVNELETMNKEFMDLNGKLQRERDELLNTIQCLQSSLNKQRIEMKQVQYPMNTPWYS